MADTKDIAAVNEPGSFSEPYKTIVPVAAILTAVFLWGCSFVAMRICVKVLNPWSVIWCRMIIAFMLLAPFAGRLKLSAYRPGDWKLLVPMVLFQPCLYFLLESYALRFTTSSQAGVISAAVPLLVAIGAWMVLSEPVGHRTITGLFIAISGVVCLSLMEGPGGSAENSLLGNFLEFGAMACAAANILIVKKMSEHYNPWLLTSLQVLSGVVFFLPGAFFLPGPLSEVWDTRMVVSLLFLGAFVTLGAFGLYNWGMSKISATRASAFINLVPVTAVVMGWTLLGENLNPGQCLAAVAVVAGVLLSQTGTNLRSR
jgi:drug/metabolite transporter (DMT)-like permease